MPPTVAELKYELFALSDRDHLEVFPNAQQAQVSLDFQTLPLLKLVEQHFKKYGIQFGVTDVNGVRSEVIALIPSNQRFIKDPAQIVLMPKGNIDSIDSLVIELSPLVKRITLWGRSTELITLQTLDREEQLRSTHNSIMGVLPGPSDKGSIRSQNVHQCSLLPRQVFKLDTTDVKKITLSSDGPFVVEGISVG